MWGLNGALNYIFQLSNYTLRGSPGNPQDMSPCLSDDMGISHYCELPAVSGVQRRFNMEHLPEAFPSALLLYSSVRVIVLLEVFDE